MQGKDALPPTKVFYEDNKVQPAESVIARLRGRSKNH
jgi:hypothetical protein